MIFVSFGSSDRNVRMTRSEYVIIARQWDFRNVLVEREVVVVEGNQFVAQRVFSVRLSCAPLMGNTQNQNQESTRGRQNEGLLEGRL